MAKRKMPVVDEEKVAEPKAKEVVTLKKVMVVNLGRAQSLNVRAHPEATARILFKVPLNTILIVNEILPHWLNVCAFDGAKCGWVARIYTQEA